MRPNGFFARLWPLLFGYDFFISYCRDDASKYAETLNACLRAKGFVFSIANKPLAVSSCAAAHAAPALRSDLTGSRRATSTVTVSTSSAS